MSELRVERVSVVRGGRTVLDVAALTCPPGAVTVIAGVAGSGKTVLAAALLGALPAEGAASVGGRRLEGSPAQRRAQGIAGSARDDTRIAGCTLIEALRLAATRSRRPGAALERLPQLAAREHVSAALLSGGEQQLLQVACAWLAAPEALVLDTPTVGLAADAAAAVTALARSEAERGCAVLWLDSDARAAPADAAATLVRGRLAAAAASDPPAV